MQRTCQVYACRQRKPAAALLRKFINRRLKQIAQIRTGIRKDAGLFASKRRLLITGGVIWDNIADRSASRSIISSLLGKAGQYPPGKIKEIYSPTQHARERRIPDMLVRNLQYR